MTRCSIALQFYVTATATTLGLGPISEATAANSGSSMLTEQVSGPRPVASALFALSMQHGYVISYEDPMFVYSGDLEDVTNQVRRDLDQYEQGKAPRVISSRGGIKVPGLAYWPFASFLVS